ncbi:MAG: DUF4412 domain-containing protein [Deltaproteobacteria bacterium]|nr:DUF4412 domain-containing protein [Deltaproteobacteria bacterium]
MKKGLTRIVAALLFALLMPSMVFAGYEITQSQTGMHGASKSKIFISKNKYMVRQPESQMSVNFATQRISITNESQKTYWEGTIDEYIKSMQEMQDASMKRMKEALQKLPESQRKEIMAIHGIDTAKPKIDVSVKKAGKAEKIAGYRAEQYTVNNNGQPFEELWLAPGLNIAGEISPEKLQAFSAKLQKTTMGGSTQGEVGLSKAYMGLLKHGYPVKQVFEKNMMTVAVDSVKKANIPDKVFQAPAGYTKVPSLQEFIMSRQQNMNLKMQ